MEVSAAVARAASMVGERTEQGVLQRLVDAAADLTGSWTAVAVLLGADGSSAVITHHGLDRDQISLLRLLPRPDGLLARVLEGTTIRLDDWTEMLGSQPPATKEAARIASTVGGAVGPFLGVPIADAGEVLGAVYVGRRPQACGYSDDDVSLVEALAAQAGRLTAGMRRSSAADLLIARLGRNDTVRSTDQAGPQATSFTIRRLLASVRRVLGTDLAYLTRVDDDRQTIMFVDGPAGGPNVQEGARFDLSDSYCGLLLERAIPASVPDVVNHPVTGALPVTAGLGAGSYCGVEVRLPDGSDFGTLCGLSVEPGLEVSAIQLTGLRVLADLVGVELGHQRAQQAEVERRLRDFALSTQPARRSIHLQPIVDLRDRRTVGFEALTRFTDVLGRSRRPDLVLGEAATLGVGVGLEQAIAADALELLPTIPDDCYLSVNLSPHALTAAGTFSMLTSAVRRRPGQVVVELTEHEEVSDYAALIDVFDELRRRGLRLAIDDTGAGYASLRHVTRLRPDIVKLDIAFVRDVHLDPGRRAVARALTAFAADVGAQLVAEGIEIEAEADELIRLGAGFGQGYLYGRPEPADVAVARSSALSRG